MNEAILIIMLMVNGNYVHHTKHITNHGYYNYSACMYIAKTMRMTWTTRLRQQEGSFVNIECHEQWINL